jgi:hypothetical protein
MDFDKETIRLRIGWRVRRIGVGYIKAEITSFRAARL